MLHPKRGDIEIMTLTIREFVNREVYVNASHLVDEVIKLRNSASIDSETLNEFYYDYWATSDHLNNEVEVFEWWVVSGWLGRKLESKGELIIKSGTLTIWGRTTTGQHITMDYVIEKIYENLVSFLHS